MILVDTHAFLWSLSGDPALTSRAREVLQDKRNTILVSAASAWEIATKARIGKLAVPDVLLSDFMGCLTREGFTDLPISVDHAQRAGTLPGHHKDPFDRMLIAQAQAENALLISNDAVFDHYGVRRLW